MPKYKKNTEVIKSSAFKMKYKNSAFPFKKFEKFKTFSEKSDVIGAQDVFEKSLDNTEKIKERAKNN